MCPPRLTTLAIPIIGILLVTGCRTLDSLPPVDLSEPGWTIRHGQALWTPPGATEELAGELMVAWHPDGRSFLQFTKTPLPIVVAQVTPESWRIEFPAQNETVAHRGSPPARLTWLHLPAFLSGAGSSDASSFLFEGNATDDWSLLNRATLERIRGYLDP